MARHRVALLALPLLLSACAGLTGTSSGDRPPYVVGEQLKTVDLSTLDPAAAQRICWLNLSFLQVEIPPWEESYPWTATLAGGLGPLAPEGETERENRRICAPVLDTIVVRFDPDLPPSPPPGAF